MSMVVCNSISVLSCFLIRSSVDLKSCQTVLPGFTPHQGMSPQSIAMSLSSSMPSQAIHQAQPPNLTLFGSAGNLQTGKVTTPLTHLGIAPHTLQSAMLHLSRQTQEQSGIVLPQNHFNNQGKSIAALFSFKKVLVVGNN